MADSDLRKQILKRYTRLRDDFSLMRPKLQEIQRFILPSRGRNLSGDDDETEDKRFKSRDAIFDNTAGRAIRVVSAGLQSGLVPLTRPWFEFSTGVEKLDMRPRVRQYLWDCAEIQRAIFARSGFYQATHEYFNELTGFGTGVVERQESLRNAFRFRAYTAGEYLLAQNAHGEVDTCYRELWMSASSMVEEFGEDAVSSAVKEALRNNKDARFCVIHAVEPNDGKIPMRGPFRPWRSVYLEKRCPEDKVLRIGGYRRFRYQATRWTSPGGQVYGEGLGHDILPDTKQLQHEQGQKLDGLEKLVTPPTVSQGAESDLTINTYSGGHTFDTSGGVGRDGLKPLYQVDLPLQYLTADINDVRQQIRLGAYNDLFVGLMDRGTAQPLTATETLRRHEERLAQIGPALEMVFETYLKPTVNDTFEELAELGLFPPPPEELEGADLGVEFTGPLAIAMRMIGLGGIEQFSSFVATMAPMYPALLDKVDLDKTAEIYAHKAGTPPEMMVDDEVVADIRSKRAEQQQAQQMLAAGKEAAQAAKLAAEADTGGNTVLSSLLGSAPQ